MLFTSLSDPLPLPLELVLSTKQDYSSQELCLPLCKATATPRRGYQDDEPTSEPSSVPMILQASKSTVETATYGRKPRIGDPSSEDHRSRSFTHRINGNKRPPSKFKVLAKTTDYFNWYFDSPALKPWEDQSIHPNNQSVDSTTSIRGKQSYTISGCCC